MQEVSPILGTLWLVGVLALILTLWWIERD
jgi:hypothetical protein